MSTLPNYELAEIDIAKLRDYCLSPTHPRGRHKARIFYSALGIKSEDAEWLRQNLLAALPEAQAEWQGVDQYGERWATNLPATRQNKKIVIRTIWLIEVGTKKPRLVTCWID